MKTLQNIQNKIGIYLAIGLLFLSGLVAVQAQISPTDFGNYGELKTEEKVQIKYEDLSFNTEKYLDLKIPASPDYRSLIFTAKGAAGGTAGYADNAYGGEGATVTATFRVGTEEESLKPGSTIRFIMGEKGHNGSHDDKYGSGGGGGSGIVYQEANSTTWRPLVVAGGGGGGIAGHNKIYGKLIDPNPELKGGLGGTDSESGGHSEEDLEDGHAGGTAGKRGEGGGGGGLYNGGYDYLTSVSGELGFDQNNEPVGGAGGESPIPGGFGFGAGGSGQGISGHARGGGGGGYSGGGRGGKDGLGGGGGSFVNPWAVSATIEAGERGWGANDSGYRGEENGYVLYTLSKQAAPSYDVLSIRPAVATSYCLDVADNAPDNGANIRLWTCTSSESDGNQWYFDDGQIKLKAYAYKCLDLNSSNTSNGSNIQLWTCNNTDAQQWIFDAVHQRFRSAINPDKCLDISAGHTNDGGNIQIWDCLDNQYRSNQQWIVKGTSTTDVSGPKQAIRMAATADKCIDVDGVIGTGNNIQLWNCNGTANQQWAFDDWQIKLTTNPTKCLELAGGQTAKGTNIQIGDCAPGKLKQVWLFDGISQSILSGKDRTKCVDVSGNPAKGANIQLWTCNGTDAQRFVME